MLDYEVLRVIWWALVGYLADWLCHHRRLRYGGRGAVAHHRQERHRATGDDQLPLRPHWDGNQVWLITAGGAIFAAWPTGHATAFSGFYVAMVLTLMALFFRPVGF